MHCRMSVTLWLKNKNIPIKFCQISIQLYWQQHGNLRHLFNHFLSLWILKGVCSGHCRQLETVKFDTLSHDSSAKFEFFYEIFHLQQIICSIQAQRKVSAPDFKTPRPFRLMARIQSHENVTWKINACSLLFSFQSHSTPFLSWLDFNKRCSSCLYKYTNHFISAEFHVQRQKTQKTIHIVISCFFCKEKKAKQIKTKMEVRWNRGKERRRRKTKATKQTGSYSRFASPFAAKISEPQTDRLCTNASYSVDFEILVFDFSTCSLFQTIFHDEVHVHIFHRFIVVESQFVGL